MPKANVFEGSVLPPQVVASPSETKLRAIELVKVLEISTIVWAGTKVQFGLSDGQFLTEPQIRAYIKAFLSVPARR